VQDNFFEMGGHSLLATQMMARIRDTFQIELPLRTLFENPSVQALATKLSSSQQIGSARPSPAMRRRGQQEAPLSLAQQRLWILDQLIPGSSLYNIPLALRLHGKLHREIFENAMNKVIERHEILRTVFTRKNREPIQMVCPTLQLRTALIDLRALQRETLEKQITFLASDESRRGFNLASGPLLRATFLRLADDEHVLLLSVSHIIFDGWSFGILAREISLLYSACLTGKPCQLPPLLVQYSDYSMWQREWLHGAALENQVNYWRRKLQGIRPLNMPTDRPRPAIQTFRGGIETFTLPNAATNRLRDLTRTEGSTLFMTLLAAFKVLLAWHSGQTDIAVGAGIANRGRSELEPLIGFFVNTLVLRTDLAGNPTFRELLSRIRETTLGAYAHQDLPFERLFSELELIRDPSRPPLYQVVFGLDTLKHGGLELDGISCSLLGLLPVSAAKAELTMVLEERNVNITGALEYNSDLFSSVTAKTLIASYTDLIVQIGERPDTSLDVLSQSLTQLKLRRRNIRYQADVARLKVAGQRPAIASEPGLN